MALHAVHTDDMNCMLIIQTSFHLSEPKFRPEILIIIRIHLFDSQTRNAFFSFVSETLQCRVNLASSITLILAEPISRLGSTGNCLAISHGKIFIVIPPSKPVLERRDDTLSFFYTTHINKQISLSLRVVRTDTTARRPSPTWRPSNIQ